MVEGQPLHYYNAYNVLTTDTTREFTFFNRTDPYYSAMELHHDDLIAPSSPNSNQSDSENSLSSVEISPRQIYTKNNSRSTYKNEIKCCWKSCGIYFDSLDQLASHVTKVHAASGPGGLFYCGWEGCTRNNRGFNARYKMLVHVRTHTNEKPHQCQQCEKSFSRAENLKIHSRSHSGEKPYVCPVPGCNKAYSNSSDRFKHTRTHQVEKPYQCKVPGCSKRYTDPSSLRKHVKTYKHFVNGDNVLKSNEKIVETNIHENIVTSTEDRLNDESSINEQINCNCNCDCCCNNSISKTSELLRIGALINLKNSTEDKTITWNPFESTNYIIPDATNYHHIHDAINDVDMPLDLSMRRQ